MNKKILIVGGDSYIGGLFIKKYSNKHKIISYSRHETPFVKNKISKDFKDISIEDYKWADVVINFAAIVHRKRATPSIYYNINHKLAVLIGETAKRYGCSQFIQMSTIAVYRKASIVSIESDEYPTTLYGKSKLLADSDITKLINKSFKVTIIRPPMVYGGGCSPGNMQSLIRLVKSGFPLPLAVDAKKSFINVHNLINFIEYSINNELCGIYIPTDGEDITIESLILIITDKLNIKRKIFALNNYTKKVLKLILPKFFFKIFETQIVLNNVSTLKDYKSISTLREGISEMIISMYPKKNI